MKMYCNIRWYSLLHPQEMHLAKNGHAINCTEPLRIRTAEGRFILSAGQLFNFIFEYCTVHPLCTEYFLIAILGSERGVQRWALASFPYMDTSILSYNLKKEKLTHLFRVNPVLS